VSHSREARPTNRPHNPGSETLMILAQVPDLSNHVLALPKLSEDVVIYPAMLQDDDVSFVDKITGRHWNTLVDRLEALEQRVLKPLVDEK
jgi:hypothetical protein